MREYRLDLDVNHRTLAFSGSVQVHLEEAVRSLRLNTVRLEIEGVEPAGRWTARPESEETEFELGSPTDELTVRFRGRATDQGLLGLYRSRYGNSHILTTQCAATAARNLFPCLDRPDRRAVVRLRLTIDAGLEAIFNTPERARELHGGRITIEFEPTPPMATYLTYLAVGRFDWLRNPEVRPAIAVAAPPGRAASGQFAVDRASEILPAFESYFAIPFPLAKLDLIAVPEFAYGAMENWGAISFRDMRLLVDRSTSALQRRATLTTIAHEIAHQWFGNLVTMEWWTDIWLNESFATFMEEKILERLEPASRPLDDLLLDWTGPALLGDSLPSTHPVSVPVERPEEIGQIFDEISYGKGSAVLRMVEAYVGPEPFRAGVNAYLKEHAYGNAASEDLWRALEGAAGTGLRPMLAAWVTRPGLPVVRARRVDGAIELTQERFLLDGRHRAEAWPIPLSVPTGAERSRPRLDGPGPIRIPDPGGPVRLNVGSSGFYRVHYDPELYDRLLAGLAALPSEERWSVVTDLAAFLVSGDIPPDRYFGFLDAARAEEDPLVVHELAKQLATSSPGRSPLALGALLQDRASFRAHAAPFLAAQVHRLGLVDRPDEPETVPVVRGIVAASALAFDPALGDALAERFEAYGSVAPDLRWPVLFAFGRRGGDAEFDRLVRLLPNAADEGEANRQERALARFPHAHLVERALELALSPVVNRAHLVSVVREAALNPVGRSVTWEWIRTVLPTVQDRYRGTSVIGQILETALPFAALGRAEEARAELAAHPFAEGARGTDKGLAMLGLYERLLGSVA